MENNESLYSTHKTNKTNYFKINLYPENLRRNIYRPINPLHPYISSINPEEISKKENAHLFNNQNLKDILMKYHNDKRKNSYDIIKSHKYFYDKFKDEEKKYYLAIKILLKKDFNNLPYILSDKKDKKKNNLNLRLNFSRNNKQKHLNRLLFNNYNNQSVKFLTTHSNSKSPELDQINNSIYQYSEKNTKGKNFLATSFRTKSLEFKNKLNKTVRSNKDVYSPNKVKIKNIQNLNIKKPLSFSYTNINSAKLGKMSIFGVFEDNGYYGKMIISLLINYFIDYFEKSNEMVVCLEKNNFYSILHWAFVNAQNYLIKNQKRFNIDLSYSGCMGTILLVPKNSSYIFYCANTGKCKCIIYTNRGIDTLNFKSDIGRASERDRIFEFNRFKKIKKLEKELNIGKANANEAKTNEKEGDQNVTENKNNNNNYIKEEIKLNEEEEKINEQKYVKYFKDFGITRCFGNISGVELGLIPDPEVTECDIRANKVKFAIIGNTVFWKYLEEKEVIHIISKYSHNVDTLGATKELEDLMKQKVGISSKALNEYSFSVVFFDAIV